MVTAIVAVISVVAGAAAAWLVLRSRSLPHEVPEAVTPPDGGPAWSSVVDRLNLGVVVMGRDGSVRHRNESARAMAGTHTGLLVDQAVEGALRRAIGGRDSRQTLELYGPPQVAVVVAAEPLPDGSAFATIEDVSERRRVDAVRTDFIANISHELKTPVGALAVLAEALADEDDVAVVHRVADRMVSESHRVARAIDDLMELSRIELGEEPVRAVVPVLDVVSGAVDRAAPLAEARGIAIAVLEIPAGIAVLGDRRQLMSALGNLVENAVKYSEDGGGVQVRVRVTPDGEVGQGSGFAEMPGSGFAEMPGSGFDEMPGCGFAEMMVADQGVGIPVADHSRIFERFYRVDRARSRDTGGTGLGLSIVRHVATNHGGEVLVSSQEGEGSTFVLRIPLAPGHARSEPAHEERTRS